VPRSGAPQPDADIESLIEDLRRTSLAAGEMPVGHPVIPSPGAAPPPTEAGSISPAEGTIPPWAFPYGLNTAAQGYASSINTSMGIYEELPRHHLRSALDLVASMPASEYLDSTKTPGTELRAIASRRYGSMDRRPHMHPSYYYFGAPDSDSAGDSYDPIRECFQIDGAIVSDLEAEVAARERNTTPPHAAHPGDDAQLLEAD
jgi:hypothetical protein